MSWRRDLEWSGPLATLKDKLFASIDGREEELVALTQELIRFPTINPPGDASSNARWNSTTSASCRAAASVHAAAFRAWWSTYSAISPLAFNSSRRSET